MLKRLIAGIAWIAFFTATALPAATSLSSSFQNPPDSAKPWVYWFWLDGNLTKEGITADLEAMQRVGIRGAIIMEVDAFIPKGPARILSPKWRELYQFVLKEATRLGLEIDMNNDGGWCGSGGPWVTPELAMQVLVSSETHVSGARRFEGVLPRPKATEGFYRDIAVLAFPTPPNDAARMAAASPKFTLAANHQVLDAAKLTDGNAATVEDLPALRQGESHTIDIEFPHPFSARALTVAMDRYQPRAPATLAVSKDGRDYTIVRRFDAVWPLATVNFDQVSSRYFRLTLTPQVATTTHPIGEVELHGGARIEGIAGKAAYGNEPFLPAGGNPQPGSAAPREAVRDISARMDPDGRLNWDVPPGDWTVLRIGHTITGKRNHPAPLESIGLECDKLSVEAVDAHFNALLGKLIEDQRASGAHALKYVHIDSWETGSQNWTPRLREEFRARRGYDLFPYLPVMTGRIVESQEASERFLWDLRRTVADLVLDHYAGRFQELSHRNGLKLSIEAYGNGPLDNLPYAGRADLPMTEFWTGVDPWYVNKEMASAAHTYGRPVLAAEAFTSRSPAGKWQSHPFRMKPLGDEMFTAGVNKFVFHRYAMQPWMNRWPGMTMGPYGIEFERTVTWWEQSKAYLAYLARCQYLLQQGQFVADVAYLSGEKLFASFQEPSLLTPETPAGYDYDALAPELLSRMKVSDGRLTLPSGMSYRVLVLPPGNTMRLAHLRRIRDLVAAGATVVGPPPSRSPSLSESGEGDAAILTLAAELWGNCDGVNNTENRFGKGKVVWGKPLAKVLSEAQAPPDFASLGVETGKQIRYIHRTVEGKEVYFVASADSQAATFLCTFRATGTPELWWPDSGRMQKLAVYDRQAAQTRIPIRLEPYGSVFVVFGNEASPDAGRLLSLTRDQVEVTGIGATAVADLRGKLQGVSIEQEGAAPYRLEVSQRGVYEARTADGQRLAATVASLPPAIEVTGPWELTFPKGWSAPESVTMDPLVSWTARPEEGVKYFSGTATYRRSISIPAAMLGAGHGLYLDLGRVEVIAEVKLNGHDLGILWKPPFRVEIGDFARAGENDLEVRVVNLWPNRLIGDAHLPEDVDWDGLKLKGWPQWLLDGKPSSTGRVTFTTWRHWTAEGALLESGLLGPVRLEPTAKVLLSR